MDVLAGFERDSFDAVVTDPPWNLGKDYGAHDDAMPSDAHVAWLAAVLDRCRRVSRGPVVFLPGGHMVERVPEVLGRAGLAYTATLTWRKPAPEPVVWAGSPGPAADVPTVIVAREPPAGAHPCPKPVELMAALVEAATPEGGVVLDPFAGSGTTLIAAAARGRSAVGIELDPRYAALARSRMCA